jgi:hypothetical protein
MKQKGALTGSRKEEEEKGRKMGHEVFFVRKNRFDAGAG